MFTILLQGKEALSQAVELLRSGELVAFPTETVYGLGGLALDSNVVKKIFVAKGRPPDNPLILHIGQLQQLQQLSREPPPAAYQLAKAFWPGPLTLILLKQPHLPDEVTGGLDSVAVRMPAHPLALALLQALGEPLAAPSANLSGHPSPTSASHVLEDLSGRIAAVVDGGECRLGLESTVLSLLDPERPLLLRPGPIGVQKLEDCLGISIESHLGEEQKRLSPGTRYRHYAPKAPLRLFFSKEELLRHRASAVSCRRGWLLPPAHPAAAQIGAYLPLEARLLYRHLRLCDEQNVEEICALCDSSIRAQPDLLDRLLRAAAMELGVGDLEADNADDDQSE